MQKSSTITSQPAGSSDNNVGDESILDQRNTYPYNKKSNSSKSKKKFYSMPECTGRFTSLDEYSSYYLRAIRNEISANKRVLQEAFLDNITMHWHSRECGSMVIVDAPPTLNRRRYAQTVRIFMNIPKEYIKSSFIGVIVKVTDRLPLKMFVFCSKQPFPKSQSVVGSIYLVPINGYKCSENSMMLENLHKIHQEISSQVITNGPRISSTMSPVENIRPVSGNVNLNESQLQSLNFVFRSSLSLVQGPPGTGKSTLATSIIYNVFHKGAGPILVCAPSNSAVNNLTMQLMKTELEMTRVVSYNGYNRFPDNIKQVSLLQKIIDSPASNSNFSYQANALLYANYRLDKEDEQAYNNTLKDYQIQILSESDVVLCTCAMANSDIIKTLAPSFKFVLIDESTQAIEPDCLLPLELGSNHVVLLSDHMQLGPMVNSKKLKDSIYAKSLFERLIDNGHEPFLLGVQYRMHPKLYELPKRLFYDNAVQSRITAKERTPAVSFSWPSSEYPMML